MSDEIADDDEPDGRLEDPHIRAAAIDVLFRALCQVGEEQEAERNRAAAKPHDPRNRGR